MQVSFYGKTYSFNTKQELYRVMDEIYYYAQDKEKELIRDFDDKKEKAIQKLRKDAEDMYRKLKDKESDLKNSKGEDMNHYEKIIQEKKNDSQVIERGTVKGVKYFIEKITGYKRSVYRGNLEKDGRVVTSTWTCDTIDECKREINKLRDTDALLNNSKEEKDNSTVIRGTVHGHKYEVDRMSDGSYMGYVYDEEDFPIFKTGLHSTAAGAEQEIKGKVFNSKEKTNLSSNFYSLIEEGKKRINREYEMEMSIAKNKYEKRKGQPGAENDFAAEVKKIEEKHQKEIEKLWKDISEEHR